MSNFNYRKLAIATYLSHNYEYGLSTALIVAEHLMSSFDSQSLDICWKAENEVGKWLSESHNKLLEVYKENKIKFDGVFMVMKDDSSRIDS